MTRDVIEMAKKAWAESGESWVKPEWFEDRAAAFERFAQLARADEREQMAQEGWRRCAVNQRTTQFCGQLQQAVEAERRRMIYASPHIWSTEAVKQERERLAQEIEKMPFGDTAASFAAWIRSQQ